MATAVACPECKRPMNNHCGQVLRCKWLHCLRCGITLCLRTGKWITKGY